MILGKISYSTTVSVWDMILGKISYSTMVSVWDMIIGKISYSTMVSEIVKWFWIPRATDQRELCQSLCSISPSKVNQFFRLVGTINNNKFQWNRLITFAVILLTDRMTERMTDKPHGSHNVHQLAACTDVSIQTLWRLVDDGSIWKLFLQHRRFYQRNTLLPPTY